LIVFISIGGGNALSCDIQIYSNLFVIFRGSSIIEASGDETAANWHWKEMWKLHIVQLLLISS